MVSIVIDTAPVRASCSKEGDEGRLAA